MARSHAKKYTRAGANAQELARRDHVVEHYAWDLHYNHLARALVNGSAYTITDNGTLAAEPNHVSIGPKPPVSSVHQRAGKTGLGMPMAERANKSRASEIAVVVQ